MVWSASAHAELAPCARPSPSEPLFITEACVDPELNRPVIEVDEQRATPVPHRYVNGRFEGTQTRFSFYFPPEADYQGRFFQYTQPAPSSLPGAENTADNNIAFGADQGAYYVQTNGGGEGIADVTINGYRADAAAAMFARTLAVGMYGEHRPYGYHYGGSGGGFKTIAAAESTSGIWDGSLPFVIGSPMALPNVYSVRANALQVLRRGDRCGPLVDAVEPGGTFDLYAGLNGEERQALMEATRFGFPPRAWYACSFMNVGALPLIAPLIETIDPTYFTDFWSKPGYLGTNPDSSVRDDRVQFASEVAAVVPKPTSAQGLPFALRLASLPAQGDLTSFKLTVSTGKAAGSTLPMGGVVDGAAIFAFTADPTLAAKIQPGDQVQLDNSNFLAVQTYHRHQVPSRDYRAWDQFRGRHGEPLYPQRPTLVGPLITGTGTAQSGRIHGKVILMETLLDIDALPWQADWYHTKVKQALRGSLDEQFRLYFVDNADHGSEIVGPLNGQIVDIGRSPARLVAYRPMLESLLLDLVDWVERGEPPVASTRYRVDDEAQIVLPQHAFLRRGIQPVVALEANGRERVRIKAGQTVHFRANVWMPPGAGKLVLTEWDFTGSGDYPVRHAPRLPAQRLVLSESHLFSTPGTYDAVLRVTSHREGDASSPWSRIQNLARVRVIVE